MSGSIRIGQHWLQATSRFGVDALLFLAAFVIGTHLRFYGDPLQVQAAQYFYYPSVCLGALAFAGACYVFGLYSPQIVNQSLFTRALVLLLCLGIAFLVMTSSFYFNFSSRVGRGVMAMSAPLIYLAALAHHALILKRLRNYKERVILVVTCDFDERETRIFDEFLSAHLELVGIVAADNYQPRHERRSLGSISQLAELVERHKIDRVLCTNKGFADPALYQQICRLRYSGETVMPLINLCEDVYQLVPLELMTPEWLLNASDAPHLLYIKKAKRAFDILAALTGLLFLGPVMLLGALAVKLTSPGPVFYRQTRCGRFGRPFQVIKLRSMRVDAEAGGAVWAQTNDDRATPVGKWLRRYRIDEIPQLLNVLRGDMSFVGPRPERPEFVEQLARQIPFYRERLMVQPGITGWAQVNYPYGSTVEDAGRKLEYDLYYMKHMSVFLDCFILLDTVRIILRGGLDERSKRRVPRFRAEGENPSADGANGAPAALLPASDSRLHYAAPRQ